MPRRTPRSLLALLVPLALTACRDSPPPDPDAEVPLYPAANRPDVRGTHGAVSASHPLAAQAGLRVLQDGGNAVEHRLAVGSDPRREAYGLAW